MSLWRQLTHGMRVLTNRSAADQEVTDEAQHYLEQATAAHVARGLSPEDALRAARIELGNTAAVREQVRDYGWENVIAAFFTDLRYAARRLRSNPGFAAVSVITLALGIGASTAIFSAVNPILFEPLPYPNPKQVIMIWDTFQGARSDLTFHTYREVAERSHSFEALSVFETWQPTMTGTAEPERLDGQTVTPGYFRALGISPVIGRDFQGSDDQFRGPKVAILSDGLWRRHFGGDRAIVGRQIRLDDSSYTVIGVMPRSLENVLAPTAEIWSPLQYDPGHITDMNTGEWGHHLKMVARLKQGLGVEQARLELNGIARTRVAEFPRVPWASLKNGFIVDSLQDQVTRGIKPALLAVIGAVILVLLIACVNVTNLLLARGAQRRGEFAMRVALGAGRTRLMRQLLTESLLLAVLGGALGMVVAELGVSGLVALSPPELPRVDAITVNGAAFAFAFGIATLVGLVVGLIPALHASRIDPHTGLHEGSRRTAGSHQWTRRTLVVAEVALALVLLVSAGLLLRSLERLFAVAPGFEPAHLLTMQVHVSGQRFRDGGSEEGFRARRQFFDQALAAVRNVPGVASAAFTSLLPMSGDQSGEYGAFFENDPPKGGSNVFRYVVSPGYSETMGIALRHGRLLDEHDTGGAAPAVLISQSLARRQFPRQDPLGKRVHVGPMDRPWYTVVGVVDDLKQTSLAESQPDAVYLTPAQSWFADQTLSLVVRARGDAAALAPAVRSAIWSVDKDQAVVRVATMEHLLAGTAAARRFSLILFEAFALVALVLAATGIYGVLSGSVNERTREIGVRSALGATRGNIVGLVVRQGMTLAGVGIVIGLTGAAVATQALVTLLFGVSRLDPVTYLGVIALLAGVAGIACWVPAWRAARVDPAVTLRAE
ncbi:MAG: ABC transporter permease [Candidatus Solibacter usitatus]|nr:ABC transporter permease [Candidatus Solibacter usitatus]